MATTNSEVDALFRLPLNEFTAGRNALLAKLKKAGRKAIKPGRKARKVRVSVTVSGADSDAQTIRLSRKR